MTTTYRAYSPSRDEFSPPSADRDTIAGVAAAWNQATIVDNSTPDWQIQEGHTTWSTP